MATKSKNKYGYIIAFVLCAYLLGLCKLSLDNVIKNKNYLKSNPYFTSSEFKHELVNYFNNIQALNGIYKDYSNKSDDEKVTKEELISSKELYDSNLRNNEDEINHKYRNEIMAAENEGNKDTLNSLTVAKNKELDKLKKENTKTLEDLKKDIAAYKNKDYENIVRAVMEKSVIKYYITKGKNIVIDTNIGYVSDISSYIKNNALYSVKFPNQSLKINADIPYFEERHTSNGTEGYSINLNDKIAHMNQWFNSNGTEGYFIIPKDLQLGNYIYDKYNYYNSVQQRIIKEVIMAIASFIIGLLLFLCILRKNNEEIASIQKLTNWYNKIPLDLRIFIFIFYSFIMNGYINKVIFFYKPYNLHQVYKLTIISLYIFYFIFNVIVVANLKRNKEDFKLEVEKCLFHKLSNIIKENPNFQSAKFKVKGIIILTLMLAVFPSSNYIVVKLYPYSYLEKVLGMLSILYILCYTIFMLLYIVRISSYLSKIIKGTDEIVSGNLNYNIEETGKGDLLKLSQNINNMKVGFKKALENEIKSERLKSELITNVSHDLKTPLTSIITYIDLLKKEGLSQEESQGYIEVLDKKSQRLKLLIDDLFEASKMASGAVELNIEKLDITALLQQSLAELDEKINNSSLTFRINVPKQKVYANLDGKKIWRVFENLINNILKYSQPKTRVYIDLVEENHKILVTMKNISSYEMDFDKEEIFERFKRGDKSRNTEGSGLGLSIAKSILELQGGNLSIEVDGDLFKVKVTVHSFSEI